MDIDFVILWVDGNDPDWQKSFTKWSNCCDGDKSPKRFRDWGNLQYLFRGFENFTPWVKKIHFVTWGHIPNWLNINHPKINIVNHTDFLKEKNLPVFNSRSIEINLHRIIGLSEHFVYFNDDMFVLNTVEKERFFKQGLPRDMIAFTNVLMTHLAHIRINDLLIINKHFQKIDFLKRNFFQWFNYRYGLQLLKSLLLLPWPQITGIVDPHQPQPFLKSTFFDVWNMEGDILKDTSVSKFKHDSDVNQYLFRYWQLLSGNFLPIGFKDSNCIQIEDINAAEIVFQHIIRRKLSFLCINDLIEDDIIFNKSKKIIHEAFEKILPHKSDFEIKG